MKRILSRLLPIAFAFALALAGRADAAPVTVQANVLKACRVSSTPTVNVGNYDPTLGTATTGTADIGVRCTKDVGFTFQIDGGETGSATATRVMRNATLDPLTYVLSAQSALTPALTAIVPGTPYDGAVSASPSTEMLVTLEASVAPLQDVSPAASGEVYDDVVQFTVTVVP